MAFRLKPTTDPVASAQHAPLLLPSTEADAHVPVAPVLTL
jgi:hypothetical protein